MGRTTAILLGLWIAAATGGAWGQAPGDPAAPAEETEDPQPLGVESLTIDWADRQSIVAGARRLGFWFPLMSPQARILADAVCKRDFGPSSKLAVFITRGTGTIWLCTDPVPGADWEPELQCRSMSAAAGHPMKLAAVKGAAITCRRE